MKNIIIKGSIIVAIIVLYMIKRSGFAEPDFDTGIPQEVTYTEDAINVSGKQISVLDKIDTTLSSLNDEPKDVFKAKNSGVYTYSDLGLEIETFKIKWTEYPLHFFINKEGITSYRNIGVGNTKDQVYEAYGLPAYQNEDHSETYTFSNCIVQFRYNDNDIVESFYIENTDTRLRMNHYWKID
ncbi:hypothetical protein [Butyrivibrio sp. M55]|uniref:hypothetical protein n=1 Tax=Butyrivibrio sp. M55 TaxID=1855323 RepID=UPI0008EBF6A8|nr:hypothetical protein [Butyrivibrio sp. M55]SFU38617.1 hypothetical protein SAMN05216540_101434 [Butyrivibrio sp. M55]